MDSRARMVLVNRVTIRMAIGIIFLMLVAFSNPYINVLLIICSIFSFMSISCLREGNKLNSAERLVCIKITQAINRIFE